MKVSRVSIFVLNYNGIPLMQECLPTLAEAARRSPVPVRLVVIDNQSPGEDIAFVQKNFPEFEVSRAPANAFLISFNDYVRSDTGDVALLLNNDIKVEPDFLAPLIRLFESRDDAFFASSLCWDFSKKNYEGGLSQLVRKGGVWGTRSVLPQRLRPDAENFWYSISIGAAIAVRRDRFLALGGFDDLYLPGILEDLDLCYRAWKQGWKGYFVPESVIYHKGQASFQPAFGRHRIRRMAVRNTCYFMWKNVRDRSLTARDLFWLPFRMVYALLRGDWAFAQGVAEAFGSRSKIRRDKQEPDRVSDAAILDIFRNQETLIQRSTPTHD